jgi:hypothetical protein
MADVANMTPIEPMVRFRLGTILVATTVAAVLAGLAGWYFRRQAPTAQQALLVYWGLVTTATLAAFVWRWRRSMTPDPSMGQVYWRVTSAWRWWWAAPVLRLNIVGFFLWGLVYESAGIVEFAVRTKSGTLDFWTVVLLRSVIWGIVMGMGMIINFIDPAFVCERGISMLHRPIMWNRLKEWEWMSNRPGVLRLRGTHGRAFLHVPAEHRAAIEEFVREKTELTIPDARARSAKVDDVDQSDIESI